MPLASSRGLGVVEVKTQAVATGVCGYAATLGTCRLAGCPGRDDPSDHGPARLVAAAGASAVSALLAPKVCRALTCGYGNWREDSNPQLLFTGQERIVHGVLACAVLAARSSGSFSQCALIEPSSGWWNDRRRASPPSGWATVGLDDPLLALVGAPCGHPEAGRLTS
jgi:hypothetical protein